MGQPNSKTFRATPYKFSIRFCYIQDVLVKMIDNRKQLDRFIKGLRLDSEKVNFLRESFLESESIFETVKSYLKQYELKGLSEHCIGAFGLEVSQLRYINPIATCEDNLDLKNDVKELVDKVIREKKEIWNYKEEART